MLDTREPNNDTRELIIKGAYLDALINMLLDGAKLDYTGDSLQIGNDSAIMAFIEAISYSDYTDTLKMLQQKKKKEESEKENT